MDMLASSGIMDFPRPRSRLRSWFLETGLTVPSRVSPFILCTHVKSKNIRIAWYMDGLVFAMNV